MKRYGKEFILNQGLMDLIATYMDDEKREKAHSEVAPCNPIVFLKRYLKLDPNFINLLGAEFKIEM